MDESVTFEALMRRPGLADAAIRVTSNADEPPAALRGRARYREREVWEIFVLDDSSEWPQRAVYRLIDRMDEAGDPAGALDADGAADAEGAADSRDAIHAEDAADSAA